MEGPDQIQKVLVTKSIDQVPGVPPSPLRLFRYHSRILDVRHISARSCGKKALCASLLLLTFSPRNPTQLSIHSELQFPFSFSLCDTRCLLSQRYATRNYQLAELEQIEIGAKKGSPRYLDPPGAFSRGPEIIKVLRENRRESIPLFTPIQSFF